jgi:hypothetical protein
MAGHRLWGKAPEEGELENEYFALANFLGIPGEADGFADD